MTGLLRALACLLALAVWGALLPVPVQAEPNYLLAKRAEMQPFITGPARKIKPLPEARFAPEVRFLDGSGKTRRLSDFRGKFIVLNFWATNCAPCRTEKPRLDKLGGSIGRRDVVVLSIHDRRRPGTEGHTMRQIADYYRRGGYRNLQQFLNLTPQPDLGALNYRSLPESFLIDRKGQVLARVNSRNWTDRRMIAALQKLASITR